MFQHEELNMLRRYAFISIIDLMPRTALVAGVVQHWVAGNSERNEKRIRTATGEAVGDVAVILMVN